MGIFFISWLACAIICALIASSKNRSAVGWAFTGLIFGVFGVIAIACCSKMPSTEERIAASEPMKVCPRCAEKVKAAAAVCRFCGHEFDARTIPAAIPWTLEDDHGDGYGIFRYKGQTLIYGRQGVQWMGSTFGNPSQAIAAIDGYQ
jgi:hypothetical protein